MKTFFEDYIWWFKQQGPKYGYVSSIWTAYFNARHFKRDGTYRIPTGEKKPMKQEDNVVYPLVKLWHLAVFFAVVLPIVYYFK